MSFCSCTAFENTHLIFLLAPSDSSKVIIQLLSTDLILTDFIKSVKTGINSG